MNEEMYEQKLLQKDRRIVILEAHIRQVEEDRDRLKEQLDNETTNNKEWTPTTGSTTHKLAVSGESVSVGTDEKLVTFDKDSRAKEIIREAVLHSEILRYFAVEQVAKLLADNMYPVEVPAERYIFQQGDDGKHIYVLAEGSARVEKDGKYGLGDMGFVPISG